MSAERGLDETGFIRREGAPGLVQPEFVPAVEDYLRGVLERIGEDSISGIYLYGSIPRGTARAGVSDLDGQVVLHREPTETDRRALDGLGAELQERHPVLRSADVLVDSGTRMTDPALRYDEGFHLRVLCTPFWGFDTGTRIAPHRPHLELARQLQGDWRGAVGRLDDRLRELEADVADGREVDLDPRGPAGDVCRAIGRRLTRLGFTWVMPRWGGWSSDPEVMAEVVATHEPGWAEPCLRATALGWGLVVDLAEARALLDGWGRELAAEGDRLGA